MGPGDLAAALFGRLQQDEEPGESGEARPAAEGAAAVWPAEGTAAVWPAEGTAAVWPAADGAAPIEQTYQYTIRQDGRVFVDIDAAVASKTFRPARIGLAVTGLAGVFTAKEVDPLDAEFLRTWSEKRRSADAASKDMAASSQPEARGAATTEPAMESGSKPGVVARGPIPRAILLAGRRENGPNLLLAPANVAAFEGVEVATRRTGDLAARMYVMGQPAGNRVHLAAMLAVWPTDLKDVATAAAIARDYQQPVPPVMEVGRLRRNVAGDLDGDGFAEATGQWNVEPDGQILRMRWPAGQLRFWPMLQVKGLGGKACWAYLDGRIINPVEYKSNGDAEFVVPGILSRAALLEVTVAKN